MSASCRARTIALNSCTCPPGVGVAAVLRVGREEADGVVAPVVGQPLLDQRRVVREVVHRHELDRGDAERLEVLDHRRVGDGGVGAAHVLRNVGMGLGEALHVRLVDDRVGVLVARRAVDAPVEERVDHHRLRHAGRGVVVVAAVRDRRSCSRTATGSSRTCRRWPWRRDRAAACSGCTGGRRAGRRARAPGSRSAGPARCWGGSRARRIRRPRAASPGSRCRRRRTGTTRPARRPR